MEDHIKRVKFLCWKYSLFGNEGAETGVEELYSSLREVINEYKTNTNLNQHVFAKQLSIIIYDYLSEKEYVDWQRPLKRHYNNCLNKGVFPFFIGGNHLSVLPIYNYYADKDYRTLIVSFDAHIDAYDNESDKKRLNHGNFLCHLKTNDKVRLIHIGNRELGLKAEAIKGIIDEVYSIHFLIQNGIEELISCITKKSKNFDKIHIDIDVDVFDQSFVSATGFPMPLGIYPQQMLKILYSIWNDKIVGLSITEYNKLRDDNFRSRDFLIFIIEYILSVLLFRDQIDKESSVFFNH